MILTYTQAPLSKPKKDMFKSQKFNMKINKTQMLIVEKSTINKSQKIRYAVKANEMMNCLTFCTVNIDEHEIAQPTIELRHFRLYFTLPAFWYRWFIYKYFYTSTLFYSALGFLWMSQKENVVMIQILAYIQAEVPECRLYLFENRHVSQHIVNG